MVRVIEAHALRAPSELYKRSVRKPRRQAWRGFRFLKGSDVKAFLPAAGNFSTQAVSLACGVNALSLPLDGADVYAHFAAEAQCAPSTF